MQKTQIKFTANKKTLFDANLYANLFLITIIILKITTNMKTLNVKCNS